MMTSFPITVGVTQGSHGFCSQVVLAVAELKDRLRERYEGCFPENARMIHSAIDAAVSLAWETRVPHLVLPELVAEKVQRLLKVQPGVSSGVPAYAHAA
ncbi:MAG: hypothetical protein QM796_03465 [Chthoniobacteraceae bacterium]